MNIFINIGIYQIIWFLCVYLENMGAFLSVPLLLLHLYITPCRIDDLKLMGTMLVLGVVVDGILHSYGFVSYNVTAQPIPIWLAVIWLSFATLPHHSLGWLKGHYLISALLGLLFGPLAYLGGVKLGAAYFNQSLTLSLIILSVIWTCVLPLSVYMAESIRPHKSIRKP